MMNYEIFKEVVTEKFMDYLSVHYKDMKLEIRPIDKVNVTLDGMNLVGEGDVTVTPTIYINDMYIANGHLGTYDIENIGKLFFYFLAVCDFYGQYYHSLSRNRYVFLKQARISSKLLTWFDNNIDELNARMRKFAKASEKSEER